MSKNLYILLILILSLINCTHPPKPEPALKIIPQPAEMESSNDNKSSNLKRLEENTANTVIENSTVIVKYLGYNLIEEHHQVIFRAENLPSGYIYSSKTFYISLNDGQTLENIVNVCEKLEKSEDNRDNNNCEASIIKNEGLIKLIYIFRLYNNEHIIINYSYNIIKHTSEILYRQETILIPDYNNAFCDYTFIIPEGYVGLGTEKNILQKRSNGIYVYYDKCPNYITEDIIRFTPNASLWKANISIYSELSEGFTDDVNITFPQYYHGEKINFGYYRIFSSENDSYKLSDIILNDLYYNINIPAAKKQKVGLDIYTAFTNKLGDFQKISISDIYYKIDNFNIDPEIKSKANLVIYDDLNWPGYPNYYKLGKFVKSRLQYEDNKINKTYTARELLYLPSGVSSHFTLLYNSLLNAINIKTLTLVGWAFTKGNISDFNSTFNHTWTAAFIDGKWVELDATWDLFEGVSAGHIFGSYFSDKVNYSFNEKEGVIPSCKENMNIQMINNISELEDPFPKEIEETTNVIITTNIPNINLPNASYDEKHGGNIPEKPKDEPNEEEDEHESENEDKYDTDTINLIDEKKEIVNETMEINTDKEEDNINNIINITEQIILNENKTNIVIEKDQNSNDKKENGKNSLFESGGGLKNSYFLLFFLCLLNIL